MAAKSSQTEITRLSDARDKIRSTLVNWGKAEGTERLDALATTIENIKNNGSVSAQIKEGDTYTIPEGYHNGSGTVQIVPETKTATPTKSQQTISPTSGRVLSSVTVNAIPAEFVDTSDANAVAGEILDGKFAYVSGVKVEGTMPNNGSTGGTFDGMTTTSFNIPAGYTSGGTVSLTNDIETALAAI